MPRNPFLYFIFHNRFSVVLINWIMQCMLGMAAVEIIIKFIIEVILVFIILLFMPSITINGLIAAILIAHTLNWVFNSHVVCTGRWIGLTRTRRGDFFKYVRNMKKRLQKSRFIDSVIIFGGVSRGESFKPTSDLDVRIISKKDILSQVISCLYTIRERIISTLIWFPLDLYLYTYHEQLKKHREDEDHIIVVDKTGNAEAFYLRNNRKYLTYQEFLELEQ